MTTIETNTLGRIPTLSEAARLLGRLLMLTRPHWRHIGKGLLLGGLLGLVGLATPLLTKFLYDDVLPGKNLSLMHALMLGTATLTLFTLLASAIRLYYTQVVVARINAALTVTFFDRVQRLPVTFFDSARTGEVLGHAGDIQRSIAFVRSFAETVFVNGLYVLIVPFILITLDWRLAAIALASLPITAVTSLLAGRVMRRLSKKTLDANAEVGALQFEVLSSIRVVKACGAEEWFAKQNAVRVMAAQRSYLEVNAVGGAVDTLNAMLRALSTLALNWVAWLLILREQLSIGTYLAFSGYLGLLMTPSTQLLSLLDGLQQIALPLSRWFGYLDRPTEQDRAISLGDVDLPPGVTGSVQFDHVSFGYNRSHPILTDVTLEIAPGEKIVVVGKTGAGKSSLVRLLLRMYEPTEGTIRLDYRPLQSYAIQALRRELGVVWQDNGVLSGTIRDNILFGRHHITADQLARAVAGAQLEAVLRDLPLGLDTQVGEAGVRLSGGQRQRIAIARALAHEPGLLVMDEATSNLDMETEQDLLRAIFSAASASTVIFVTHRLQSARLANRVYVVDDGRVQGGVPHDVLLENSAGYRRLCSAAGLQPVEAVHEGVRPGPGRDASFEQTIVSIRAARA